MKVRYSRRALAQLDDIYNYIEAHDAQAAAAVKARIKRSIDRLARFPYSGRATDNPSIRLLAIRRYPYLVFYSVDDDAREVHILRVRHSVRDPEHHLE